MRMGGDIGRAIAVVLELSSCVLVIPGRGETRRVVVKKWGWRTSLTLCFLLQRAGIRLLSPGPGRVCRGHCSKALAYSRLYLRYYGHTRLRIWRMAGGAPRDGPCIQAGDTRRPVLVTRLPFHIERRLEYKTRSCPGSRAEHLPMAFDRAFRRAGVAVPRKLLKPPKHVPYSKVSPASAAWYLRPCRWSGHCCEELTLKYLGNYLASLSTNDIRAHRVRF
jgi:hypothetical protein